MRDHPRTVADGVTVFVVAIAVVAVIGPASAGGLGSLAGTTPDSPGHGPSVPATGPAAHHPMGQPSNTVECSFPVEYEDVTGTTVRVETDPERVVTLAPSAAQTMWELEARDDVVGVSQFAAYLPGATEKSNISAPGFGNYDVERIVELEPDLVLAPNVVSNQTVGQLRNVGLTVVKLSAATSIEDVARKTTLIGRLTGNCEAAAETNRWMSANVDAAQNATADNDRTRVLYLTGTYTTGGETFINDMIYAAGGRNIIAEAGVNGFAPVNKEIVAERDPEWIVVTFPGTGVLEQAPYNSTTAGQEENLLVVNVNYLNQPAPRSVVFATRNMTEAFHPDAYGPSDYVSRSAVETTTTTSPTPSTTTTTTTTETTTDTTETTTTTTATDPGATPGFGVIAGLVALVGVVIVVLRRR